MGFQQLCVACVCLIGAVVSAQRPLECAMVRCAWPVCPPGEEPVDIITECCHVCRPIGRYSINYVCRKRFLTYVLHSFFALLPYLKYTTCSSFILRFFLQRL